MKNRIHQLITLTAVCAALCGCSTYDAPNEQPSEERETRVQFQVDVAGEENSRANITTNGSTFFGTWELLDLMGVVVTAPGSVNAVCEKFSYNGTLFDGTLPSAAIGAWKYIAFAPHTTTSGTIAALPFGNKRTQNGNHYNSNYDAMTADVVAYANAAPGKRPNGDWVAFQFNRLTSILHFNLQSTGTNKQVKSLLLTSKRQKLSANSLQFDVAQGSVAHAALHDAEQSKVILMDYAAGTSPTTNQIEAYFNILAGNYDELTLDVLTQNKQMCSLIITRNDVSNPFIAGKLHSYNKSTPLVFAPVVAPSLTWANQDLNATHEIAFNADGTLAYPIDIQINAPAGLAGLDVHIVSAPLNTLLKITDLDLFNDTQILPGLSYQTLGLACSTQIQYTKTIRFDLTALVASISTLPINVEGNHIFSVKITDLAGNVVSQDLKFHYKKATRHFAK
ncbi:MAG: hypothetical protein RR221_04805 [Alistipes sp.]